MRSLLFAASALALCATPAFADPPPGVNADLSTAHVNGVSAIAGQGGSQALTLGNGFAVSGGLQTSSVLNGANAFATPNAVGGSSFATGANANVTGGLSLGNGATQSLAVGQFEAIQGFEALGADFHFDD
jgi:hypothetical protein